MFVLLLQIKKEKHIKDTRNVLLRVLRDCTVNNISTESQSFEFFAKSLFI